MTIPFIAAALRRRRNRGLLFGFATITMALLGTISVAWFGGYRINLTPSERLGLWRIIELDRPAPLAISFSVVHLKTSAMREAKMRWLPARRPLPRRASRRSSRRSSPSPDSASPLASASASMDIRVRFSALQHRDGKGRR